MDLKKGSYYLVKQLGRTKNGYGIFPPGIRSKKLWVCKLKHLSQLDDTVCFEFLGKDELIVGHSGNNYKTKNHWYMDVDCVVSKVDKKDVSKLEKSIWIGDI
jgi:hypothetical protein